MPRKKNPAKRGRQPGQLSQGLYEWLHALDPAERALIEKRYRLNGFALAASSMEELVALVDQGIKARRLTVVPDLIMTSDDIQQLAREVSA